MPIATGNTCRCRRAQDRCRSSWSTDLPPVTGLLPLSVKSRWHWYVVSRGVKRTSWISRMEKEPLGFVPSTLKALYPESSRRILPYIEGVHLAEPHRVGTRLGNRNPDNFEVQRRRAGPCRVLQSPAGACRAWSVKFLRQEPVGVEETWRSSRVATRAPAKVGTLKKM